MALWQNRIAINVRPVTIVLIRERFNNVAGAICRGQFTIIRGFKGEKGEITRRGRGLLESYSLLDYQHTLKSTRQKKKGGCGQSFVAVY